jgi:cation:H+ antiporter
MRSLPTGSLGLAVPMLLVGVALVLWSVERFVETVGEAAVGLGLSPFLLTVLVAGTDVENAVLGGAAVLGSLPDVGLGTVFGEALFILCAATGLAGVLVPFAVRTPRRYLALTAAAPILLLALGYDGRLARVDGVLLVAAYGVALALLYRWERTETRSFFEVEDEPEKNTRAESTRAALGILVLTTLGMTAGSQLVVEGARGVLAWLGLSGLAFGATVLSRVASLEEAFLTVEPVRKDRPAIAVGNIVGSLIFFVTANAGFGALLAPFRLPTAVYTVQFPATVLALAGVLALLAWGRVTRAAGTLLIGAYAAHLAASVLA